VTDRAFAASPRGGDRRGPAPGVLWQPPAALRPVPTEAARSTIVGLRWPRAQHDAADRDSPPVWPPLTRTGWCRWRRTVT